jgi:hypothetical protein
MEYIESIEDFELVEIDKGKQQVTTYGFTILHYCHAFDSNLS